MGPTSLGPLPLELTFEIMYLLCADPTRSDQHLSALRLTCRLFSEILTPLLLRSIFYRKYNAFRSRFEGNPGLYRCVTSLDFDYGGFVGQDLFGLLAHATSLLSLSIDSEATDDWRSFSFPEHTRHTLTHLTISRSVSDDQGSLIYESISPLRVLKHLCLTLDEVVTGDVSYRLASGLTSLAITFTPYYHSDPAQRSSFFTYFFRASSNTLKKLLLSSWSTDDMDVNSLFSTCATSLTHLILIRPMGGLQHLTAFPNLLALNVMLGTSSHALHINAPRLRTIWLHGPIASTDARLQILSQLSSLENLTYSECSEFPTFLPNEHFPSLPRNTLKRISVDNYGSESLAGLAALILRHTDSLRSLIIPYLTPEIYDSIEQSPRLYYLRIGHPHCYSILSYKNSIVKLPRAPIRYLSLHQTFRHHLHDWLPTLIKRMPNLIGFSLRGFEVDNFKKLNSQQSMIEVYGGEDVPEKWKRDIENTINLFVNLYTTTFGIHSYDPYPRIPLSK